MKTFKKALAILLAVLMLSSLLSVAVYAEELAPGQTNYYVTGSKELAGTENDWPNDTTAKNLVLGSGGLAYASYTDVPAGTYVFKIVKIENAEDPSTWGWYGDNGEHIASTEAGNNFSVTVKETSSFTMSFNDSTGEIKFTDDGGEASTTVGFTAGLEINTLALVGNINGWGIGNTDYALTESEPNVYTGTFGDFDFDPIEFKFVANGPETAWQSNWGKGDDNAAAWDGANFKEEAPEGKLVKFTIDLTNFDFNSKTGATYSIEYLDPEDVPTEPVTEPVTESVTESATETVTETATESVTETATESVTDVVTETAEVTQTATAAVTETAEVTETATAAVTETAEVTETATAAPTETAEVSETGTAVATETATETATESETENPIKPNTFYLTGSVAGWGLDARFELTEVSEGLYKYENLELTTDDMIKAVKSNKKGTAVGSWYPDGMDNNQTVSENGTYTVYFRPAGDGTAEDGYTYVPFEGDGTGEETHGCTTGGYLFKFVKQSTEPTTEPYTYTPAERESTSPDPVEEGKTRLDLTSNILPLKSIVYSALDKTVTIEYTIKTALSVIDAQGTLTYDGTALQLVSFEAPNLINPVINTDLPNVVKFNSSTAKENKSFADGAVLVKAVFNVLKTGATTVDLDVQELNADNNGADVALITDGVKVSNDFTVDVTATEPATAPTETQAPTKAKAPALNAASKSLKAGKTFTVKVKNTTAKATFKSSNTKVAKVSAKGVVTALKKGSAKITVKVAGKTLTCKIKVTSSPKVTKVGGKKFKAKKTYTVKKGKTLKVKITGKAKAIKNKFKVTKKGAAKVSGKTTVKIKAKKKGTFQVKITVNKVKTITIKVKVK